MENLEYEKMLDRLYMLLPDKSKSDLRLEMPKPDSMLQGNKTIVKNFSQIVKVMKREEKHVLKFLTKETATSVSVDAGRLIINGKIGMVQLGKIFDFYIKRFVTCPSCGKLDTHFVEQSGVKMLKCEACGSLSAVAKV